MSDPLLPDNATSAEMAMDGAISRIGNVPVDIVSVWNAQTCPVHLLPWLAWALSVDTWSSGWSEVQKRSAIQSAVNLHRIKGTTKAVRDVVASFGAGLALREWWQTEPRGVPHTFAVTLTLQDAADGGAEFQSRVVAAIGAVKPVRSHFDFTIGETGSAGIAMLGAARPHIYRRLQTMEA